MKKIMVVLLSILAVTALVGCTTGKSGGDEKQPSTAELKYERPDTEAGVFYIEIDQSSSRDNNIPVLQPPKDSDTAQILCVANDMVGQTQYIYIDKKLAAEQEGDYRALIDIKGDALKPGQHTVNAVVFKDNNPSEGIVSFKTAKYEVK